MGRDAWRALWGPLLRGKFGERADDIAMVWLQNKFRLRRGDDAAEEKLGYPKHSWEPLFGGAARADRGRRRAGADRPPGGARSSPASWSPRARPARSGAATTRATFETLEPERYEARPGHACPATSSSSCRARPGARGYLAKLRGIEYFTALCLLIELDRRFSPYYWTNIGDDALPFVGLIEHTNLIEPARYGGRRFLYVANYLPRGHELLVLDAEGAAGALHAAACRRSTARSNAPGSSSCGCTASRPPSRSSPSATASKIPPMQTPHAGSFWPTRRRSSRRTAGTNYAVREGDEAAARLDACRTAALTPKVRFAPLENWAGRADTGGMTSPDSNWLSRALGRAVASG